VKFPVPEYYVINLLAIFSPPTELPRFIFLVAASDAIFILREREHQCVVLRCVRIAFVRAGTTSLPNPVKHIWPRTSEGSQTAADT
jgi:hypothetical protein